MRSASPHGRVDLALTAPLRLRWRAGLLCLAFAVAPGLIHAQAPTSPLPVKAAYLYKFGGFIEWPAESFSDEAAPLNLCVQGDDPFGGTLDKSIQGQQVGGHPLAVRRLARLDRDSPCHIAFVGGSRVQTIGAALAATRGAPILTVTDSGRPGARGMIDFQLVRNMVRFSIDQSAAQASRVTISSKLLSLATEVRQSEAAP